MNIKILDSWLKEYVKTQATPEEIAEKLSLTSVSIERVEKWKNDFLYDIEVTTNRPDFASVIGLAREAGAVLPESGIPAKFIKPTYTKPTVTKPTASIEFEFDPTLVNRICAVVMEVTVKPTPEKIKDRLESSDIRSLNNLIDVTNYVMRTIGHPTHVFDFDRLNTHKLIIREARKGEEIVTLDEKKYTLSKGDMVATDENGKIVDLLSIMGLANSVVTNETKRILFFVNNNETSHIRKTSMQLGIRTEAAQLNEKGVDPEAAMDALLYGIELYQKIADGKVISKLIDLYPKKVKQQKVSVSFEKINSVIGVPIPAKTATRILTNLGFGVTANEKSLTATVPTFRALDITIPEDLVEEIARVYGYYKIPDIIPSIQPNEVRPLKDDTFYWERRIRNALKYWGLTEVYTYPMVSEEMYEGDKEKAVKLANPLGTEFVYMRSSLTPSLVNVVNENKRFETIRIFEIANVYEKNGSDLPLQKNHLAVLLKEKNSSFFTGKGILEQLFTDLHISKTSYSALESGTGAEIHIEKKKIGEIHLLENDLLSIELDLEAVLTRTSLQSTIKPLSKFPPVFEDLAFYIDQSIPTSDIIETIRTSHRLVTDVALLDRYKESRTFHITYQDQTKNLTSEDVKVIREQIINNLKNEYHIKLRE